jgi:hypothetical protein
LQDDASDKTLKIRNVLKHEDFNKVPGLIAFIESMGAAGAFRSDQMASAILRIFRATVEKSLLYRTAKKAHDTMFGKYQSDVLALQELAQKIEKDGGRLTWVYGKYIGKTDGDDAEKYFGLVWIASYCHVLVDHDLLPLCTLFSFSWS